VSGLQGLESVRREVVGEEPSRGEMVLYDQDRRRPGLHDLKRVSRGMAFAPCNIAFRVPMGKDSHI